MKYLVLALYFLIGSGAIVAQQQANRSSTLQVVVETERAFAKLSEQLGTQPAFLAFIANDGILFRPTAVNGKKWMLENPVPATTKRPFLNWWPIFADASQAGDLGYTTGPWEFKADIKDAKPSAHGNFVTVWKKQFDGTWKFVIDLGISNPQPATSPVALESGKHTGSKSSNADVNAARAELVKRDWAFAEQAREDGWRNAFLSYSTSEVRLLRNEQFPFVGRDAVKKAFADKKLQWTSQPDFGDVSRSADLGYTYGTYELKSEESAKVEKGNYLRIWKVQGGVWKIVLEVCNPLPER